MSGTAIRADPTRHWRFLPRCVRPHFARRVSVFGPESTGKTTLARRLAAHLDTALVPEYARTWLEPKGGRIEPADIDAIARGQLAAEDALAREANRVLVCDTDPLATVLWSEALFGACPDWIRAEAGARRYDLTLLCDIDVPFEPDPVRYLPAAAERAAFLDRCEQVLAAAGRRIVRLRGGADERFEVARAAVADLLG